MSKQDDGSILATGVNGMFDAYTITAVTKAESIASLRLEALADASMAKGGPGRAPNGNFALSDFRVTAVPLGNPKAKAIEVKLTNPRATFEQKGLPVAATIDDDPKSAWAIDPRFGKNHAAVYDLETPLKMKGGAKLTFVLKFNNNAGHQMGRVRFSAAIGAISKDLLAPSVPTEARTALAIAADKRTAAQKQAVIGWFAPQDAGWSKLDGERQSHLAMAPTPPIVKALIASENVKATRLHTQGEDFYPQTFFLRRGDSDNKEGVAEQSFLQVLMPDAEGQSRWIRKAPDGAKTPWRRRAFAEWMTDTKDGAGRLLARVIVNRLWQHHMGRGIVATPSDFGTRGEKPSHPELLDHLAGELIERGWSLKAMHRLILASNAYQQSSIIDEAKAKIDRENKFYWHYPARRLSAEVIRDTLLSVSGELDPKLFGPGTLSEDGKRRSIYFTVKRSKLMPMMVIFDAPEALGGVADRPTTTIAPQALHLMNNANMRRYAKSLAGRLGDASNLEAAIDRGYRIALGRPADAEERADGAAFIALQMATYPAATARRQALVDWCHVLMCLNEFVYIE